MNYFGSYHFASNYFASNHLVGAKVVLPAPQVFRDLTGGSGKARYGSKKYLEDRRIEEAHNLRIKRDDDETLVLCASSFLTIISNGN